MLGNNVEIISKELIKPSSPTPHDFKRHNLSFIDQCLNLVYVPLIFVYENNYPSSDNAFDHLSKLSQHLKLSLADALTKFHHLAGRIRENAYVDCNDSGALLVEARVHSPLSQAVRNAPIEELSQYLPLEPYASSVHVATKIDDLPLLAVQISFFQCGGTAIGVCLSHKVADMASFMMFVNYWASLSRGERFDDSIAPPIFDLASQLFPGLDKDSPFFPRSDNWIRAEKKLVTKRFLFDKEKLAALKKMASLDDFFGAQVKNPSRVEVASAFIWKQSIEISRARGGTKRLFSASHAVNLRTRMKESLPSDRDVFGNLSIFATNSSVKAWGFGSHFEELVWITRSAIRRINDDNFIKHVQSGVPFLRENRSAWGLLGALPAETVDRCFFSSWCRFPIYEVDYGLGKPVAVCTVTNPVKNTVILMDTSCEDGIEALITMSEDEMAMLPDELLSLETTTHF